MVTSASISSATLREELATMPDRDEASADAAAERAASVLRPAGALAQLDELAVWVAGWQGSGRPIVDEPAVLVFAGDHGVTTEDVSAYPADITAAMLAAVERGQASINALAHTMGATLAVIDVGVGSPTGNLRVEAAMSPERLAVAFEAGRDAVRSVEADLLVLGELGIGNTTSAAALTAALLGGDVAAYVGRGTGLDDAGLANKVTVVRDAVARVSGEDDPLELLRHLGGTELAAMAGAMVEARSQSLPLLLDGYIATAPAVVLHAIDPGLVAHMRAGHRSAEPGHHLALERLGLDPLLSMDFRLGEGTGAMVAVPLVMAGCDAVSNVATFDEFFGEPPGAADS